MWHNFYPLDVDCRALFQGNGKVKAICVDSMADNPSKTNHHLSAHDWARCNTAWGEWTKKQEHKEDWLTGTERLLIWPPAVSLASLGGRATQFIARVAGVSHYTFKQEILTTSGSVQRFTRITAVNHWKKQRKQQQPKNIERASVMIVLSRKTQSHNRSSQLSFRVLHCELCINK